MTSPRRLFAGAATFAAAFLLAACSDPLGPEGSDAWVQGSWQPLGEGIEGWAHAVAEHDGALWVGGWFETAEGTRFLLRWNGEGWDTSVPDVDDQIRALVSFDGGLVALGHFDAAGGVPAHRAARWDGASWQAMDGKLDELCCFPTFAVRGSELFASGRFDFEGDERWPGGVITGIGKWTGEHWDLALVQVPGEMAYQAVLPVAVHGGDLIVRVAQPEPQPNAARWNGSSWSWLERAPAHFGRLVAVGDDLYLFQAEVYRYTGSGWEEVATLPGTVRAAVGHEGSLVVAGEFDGEGSNSLVRLTPGGWAPVGSADGTVRILGSHGSALIAVGEFTSIDGVPARGIAAFRPD